MDPASEAPTEGRLYNFKEEDLNFIGLYKTVRKQIRGVQQILSIKSRFAGRAE
jgi:hypothetical protein